MAADYFVMALILTLFGGGFFALLFIVLPIRMPKRKFILETKDGDWVYFYPKRKSSEKGLVKFKNYGEYELDPRYYRREFFRDRLGRLRWRHVLLYREGDAKPVPFLGQDEKIPIYENSWTIQEAMDSRLTEAALKQPLDLMMLIAFMLAIAVVLMLIFVARMAGLF